MLIVADDLGYGEPRCYGGRDVPTPHMGSFEPDYDADNPVLRDSQPLAEPSNLIDAEMVAPL